MTLQTWWLYLGAVVLIACTPGPNVLYVTTRSIRFGFGAAMTDFSTQNLFSGFLRCGICGGGVSAVNSGHGSPRCPGPRWPSSSARSSTC